MPNNLDTYSNKNLEVKEPWMTYLQPRLAQSQQWTPFPDELLQQIQDVFSSFFEEYDLENGQFKVDGAIYAGEILLSVGLTKPGRLRQDNFEASMEYNAEKEKTLTEIHKVIDFLGQTWQDYLEEPPEDETLPRQWTEHTFEKKKIFLKYSSVNFDLEREADKLLEQYEKKLVYGELSADATETVSEYTSETADSSEEESSLH